MKRVHQRNAAAIPMLAYGILDGDAEITDMIISALAQLCAGSVGINSANVGISSFALLTAITHLYAKCVKRFYCTRIPVENTPKIGTMSLWRASASPS